ncbi:hypothetical protein BPAE_0146g00120 [Botrytis paeoniae]|uniref:Heterokaryon incompatibility domain-containing protein n=1 Tax=Botrytis paeoniae TaxID=278948 RepID=A0A4Z1FDU5_9HELO|nr:hypothetical protein BPAE_0146g00120 [Botrytis paeoniae]
MLCKLCDSLNVADLLKLAKANSGKVSSSDDYLYFEHHKRYDDLVTAASSGYQPKFIDDIQIGQFVTDEDLATDANFDIARGWMNTCIAEHSILKCPSFEDKVLPSRVINVGSEDTNPSLLVTNGLRGKYTALSHCWGGQIETILTTSNLQSLQKGIKITSLPASFRDAILITRALGFQYLWIDSLCIIQDSKYDWGIESKNMGETYRKSVLTIRAAAAHKATDDSGSDDIVEIASSISRPEDLALLFASGPLQSRAWALQERILSPRILWYGRRQIYWQCPCGFQSANGMPSGGRGYPSSKLYTYPVITQRILFNQNYNDGLTRFSEEELLEINCEYQSIVMDYCTRTLSYPNDKFPAFSGIAALLHKVIGGHYLAGIWSKFFRENLLWHASKSRAPYTQQYRAPSWYWAVTDEGMSHFYVNSSRLESTPYDPILLSHHIELSSENPYGAVKYAYIIVDTLTLKLIHLGSIAFQNSFTNAKLRTSYRHDWDEKIPNWSAVSPFKYKVMLVGFEKRSENYRDSTPVLESGSCLKCLILQEDPEDAKKDRKAGLGCMAGFRLLGKRDPKVDLNWNLTEDGMWFSRSFTEIMNKDLFPFRFFY